MEGRCAGNYATALRQHQGRSHGEPVPDVCAGPDGAVGDQRYTYGMAVQAITISTRIDLLLAILDERCERLRRLLGDL